MRYKIFFNYHGTDDDVIFDGETTDEIRHKWEVWAKSRRLNPIDDYCGSQKLEG